MREETQKRIKDAYIKKAIENMSDDEVIGLYSEITSDPIYTDIDEMLKVNFTNDPDGAARAVYFGNISSWHSNYYIFNGYNNIESRTSEDLRESCEDELIREYIDEVEESASIDLDEFDELMDQADEISQKEDQYIKFTNEQKKELDDFIKKYMFFAFSDAQFNDGLKKINATEDEIVSAGAGGYVLKDKADQYIEILKRHGRELKEKQKDYNFLVGMLVFEMYNHEYGYTRELDDTLRACLISYEDIEKDVTIQKAIKEASDYVTTIDDLLN